MTADKTKVIARKDGSATAADEPRLVGGQIVFHCPAGHRIVVPMAVGGKRGTCSKCGVPLQIPDLGGATVGEQAAEPKPVPSPELLADSSPPVPSTAATDPLSTSAGDDADWNFISTAATEAGYADGQEAAEWPLEGDVGGMPQGGEINPMARMLARLWAERDHGGIIELHLAGGAVILPEEFSARWSGASHGLFASQAADGSVTLTAVAWDTVQRIVVRQLSAVPGDMFE